MAWVRKRMYCIFIYVGTKQYIGCNCTSLTAFSRMLHNQKILLLHTDTTYIRGWSSRDQNDGGHSHNHCGSKIFSHFPMSKHLHSFSFSYNSDWSFGGKLLQFQTQQVYCIRDRLGSITEGGQVNARSSSFATLVAFCACQKEYLVVIFCPNVQVFCDFSINFM